MNRRTFAAAIPLLPLAAHAAFAGKPIATQRAFIGTTGKDSQGIYAADFDASTGTFSEPALVAKLPGNDSMTLHPHSRTLLYTTGAVDGKAVVQSYELRGTTLQPITQQTTRGTGANFLSVDPTGRTVMEANWGSGDITTYTTTPTGTLSDPVEHIAYGEADHGPQPVQVHSRCHSILVAPGGKYVLVNDYGCDRIRVYALDAATAKLTPHDPPFYKAAAGAAPRHLVIHPNGKWIYCNNELTNTVDLLDWDAHRGTLTLRSSITTLPPDAPAKCRTADMVLSPDRRFLYATVRTLESFVTYAVQPNGTLRNLQFLPSEGVENRCITLDNTGRWLIAANQRSGDVALLPRDPRTGLLGKQTSNIKAPGACFVLWT